MKFTGTHTGGRARARTLGFPTINLNNLNMVSIENGVYAARATVNEVNYMAALFIGESPTFKDKEKSVELYLIGLSEEERSRMEASPLVKTKITVETIQYLRPVIKFVSKEALIAQIEKDVEEIVKLLS